jgi:hypothetical protein
LDSELSDRYEMGLEMTMRNDVLEGQENKEKNKMKEQNSPVTHAPIILNDNDSDAQMQQKKRTELERKITAEK